MCLCVWSTEVKKEKRAITCGETTLWQHRVLHHRFTIIKKKVLLILSFNFSHLFPAATPALANWFTLHDAKQTQGWRPSKNRKEKKPHVNHQVAILKQWRKKKKHRHICSWYALERGMALGRGLPLRWFLRLLPCVQCSLSPFPSNRNTEKKKKANSNRKGISFFTLCCFLHFFQFRVFTQHRQQQPVKCERMQHQKAEQRKNAKKKKHGDANRYNRKKKKED